MPEPSGNNIAVTHSEFFGRVQTRQAGRTVISQPTIFLLIAVSVSKPATINNRVLPQPDSASERLTLRCIQPTSPWRLGTTECE